MQPTEPSTDVQQPDSEVSSEPSPASEETASPPRWWQRLFGRHDEEPAQTEAETEEQAPESNTRTLTEQEFQRAIQSEVDRREAKRSRDQQLADKRKLRDEDPWAYAEQERQAEQQTLQNGQIEQIFSTIGAEHDRHTIDPVLQSLPKDEQTRILGLEGAGIGLEGRRLVVGEALKALEKHWKAEGAKDAESRLRKNSAFRKQVLAEMRGTTTEPELLPSGGASPNGRTSSEMVNDMLRRQIGMHRES